MGKKPAMEDYREVRPTRRSKVMGDVKLYGHREQGNMAREKIRGYKGVVYIDDPIPSKEDKEQGNAAAAKSIHTPYAWTAMTDKELGE